MNIIEKEKDYKVNGKLLILLSELIQLYKTYPVITYNNSFNDIQLPAEKRDYFIGCLASEFEHIDWEKQ